MAQMLIDAPGIELGGCGLRRAEAAEQFNEREQRDDGARIVSRLADGMTVLRNSLFTRIHDDVEDRYGMDSAIMPLSLAKSERMTKIEIEVFQSLHAACSAVDRGYAKSECDRLGQWLLYLRIGSACWREPIQQRVERYLAKDPECRRLFFSDLLVADLPEAGRAPLVLLRLFPLAVEIVTAMAFDDVETADELRAEQRRLLPPIGDCRRCGGKVLRNGDSCRECGNPIWKFKLLLAS